MNYLIATDLDRTLLPNGHHQESPLARPLLRALAARPEVTLAYVSGRDKLLLHKAIEEYDVPVPDFAVGDVGSTLYEIHGDAWHPSKEWAATIAVDWEGMGHQELAALFTDLDPLTIQEPHKQGTYKLSYYVPADADRDGLMHEMGKRLAERGVKAGLVWSVDEMAGIGLLDVLPRRATKLGAVRFLMGRRGFDERRTVFAGDSGNDLPVLTSGLQSVLVRNAADEVREEALAILRQAGIEGSLYLAKGGLWGMNGCYSAGIVEGVVHFLPQVRGWLEAARRELSGV